MTIKSIGPKITNVGLSDFSYNDKFLRGYIFTDFPLNSKRQLNKLSTLFFAGVFPTDTASSTRRKCKHGRHSLDNNIPKTKNYLLTFEGWSRDIRTSSQAENDWCLWYFNNQLTSMASQCRCFVSDLNRNSLQIHQNRLKTQVQRFKIHSDNTTHNNTSLSIA